MMDLAVGLALAQRQGNQASITICMDKDVHVHIQKIPGPRQHAVISQTAVIYSAHATALIGTPMMYTLRIPAVLENPRTDNLCYQWSNACRVWGNACRVWNNACRVWSNACRVWSNVCRVWSNAYRVWSNACRVWSNACRV
jgi:hypothetical protein